MIPMSRIIMNLHNSDRQSLVLAGVTREPLSYPVAADQLCRVVIYGEENI